MQQTSFLYVEDDGFSRQIMKIVLKDVLGYSQVTIFENSENFMQRFKALPVVPSLVFLDIHVKPHDGFEMMHMLRAEKMYDSLKIIALTASVTVSEVRMLHEAGFDGLVGKPIKQSVFPKLLGQILAGERVWIVP